MMYSLQAQLSKPAEEPSFKFRASNWPSPRSPSQVNEPEKIKPGRLLFHFFRFAEMSRSILATSCCFLALAIFFSCKKNDLVTGSDASVYFSTDSLKFDTVFTSVGSVTKSFKIFNNNNGRLKISTVKLMGGPASPYNTNINGVATDELRDIEIEANDSIYVFVTVTIDPNLTQLPFIVSDSILVEYNDNRKFVQLEAFGKNAHFLRGETISANTVFDATLPYVILDGLRVDTSVTLTISPGTQLYFHANAPLIVDGTLNARGTVSNRILFTGDRLDDYYRDLPGSWPGIYFRESSTENELQFCRIINAYQGLIAAGQPNAPVAKITIQQCEISNIYDAGLYLLASSADISNTLVANCGTNLLIRQGGNYSITHSTFASYSNFNTFRTEPVVAIYNYDDVSGTRLTGNLQASFTNCIIWGEGGIAESEVVTAKDDNAGYDLTFNHTLYRSPLPPAYTIISSSIANADPLFDSVDVFNNYYDFRISADFAPGKDAGTVTPYLKDLDDLDRNVALPDLGAYEKQ